VWEKCGKAVKKIVWKKCGKEYSKKSVEKMWKTITWEKNRVEKYVEKNSVGKVWKSCEKNSVKK
jgi:hypothetical protein